MHSWVLGAQVGSETPLKSHLTKGQGKGGEVHKAPRVSGAAANRSSSAMKDTCCLDTRCLQSWEQLHDPSPVPGQHQELAGAIMAPSHRRSCSHHFVQSLGHSRTLFLKSTFGRWSSSSVPCRGALVLLAVWLIGELPCVELKPSSLYFPPFRDYSAATPSISSVSYKKASSV